ncbi:MAG: fibrobacter succinogenes major paralogous domain-containing protein [Candidatus Fibromonas sp.]|jgi:uncharacterized protein (TIGR02145 family)|nr:fibrobacter succinogenes major paralogous domain-containing protein [Candidatus Fibromonas sp.]
MNKILLKTAAAVNIAAAAIIYMACSGDDGKDGKDCSAVPSATVAGGFDISCGGVPAGTLRPGTDAPGGGANGCYLEVVTGGYNVICNGTVAGNIPTGSQGPGCSINTAQGNPYYTFTCGADQYQLAKAICSYTNLQGQDVAEPYDPLFGVCNTSGVSGNCGGASITFLTQFCSSADLTGKDTLTVLDRCGAKYVLNELDQPVSVKPDSTGEYNPKTQFCQDATASLPTISLPSDPINDGLVRALCGTGTTLDDRKYTNVDFCSVANTILPLCKSTASTATGLTYSPASQFCQIETGTAVEQTAGSYATGVVKPRCGSESYGAATLKGLGTGTYGIDKFCSPLTSATAVAANASLYEKCIASAGAGSGFVTSAANAGTDKLSPGTTIRPTYYDHGEYDATKQYCHIEVNTSGVASAGFNDLTACPATGSNKIIDPTRNFCGPSNVVYPKCNGIGAAGTASSGAGTGDYLVTSEYCDTRGQKLDLSTVTAAVNPVVISGGKLYSYINLAGKDWTTENLNTTGLSSSIVVSAGTEFNWAQATSTTGKICPEGWRIPTNAEFNALITLATATNATPALELRNPSGWNRLPVDGRGIGFAAVASGGNIFISPTYEIKNPALPYAPADIISAGVGATPKFAAWWVSDDDGVNQVSGTDRNNGIFRYFLDDDAVVKTGSGNKLATQLSVRCVRN